MLRSLTAALAIAVLLAACGDSPTPPRPAQCMVTSADVSSNPPSTAPSPPPGSPVHALVDDFAGPAVNTDRWNPFDAATGGDTSQDDRLVIAVPPAVSSYSGVVYRLPYRFSGSSFLAEVSSVATGGSLVETVVGMTSQDEEEYVLLTSFGIHLQAVYNWRDRGCNDPSHEREAFGYTYCELGSITFNDSRHRFRRLREQNGTVLLDVSPDGATWTQPPGWSLNHHFADAGQLHGLLAAGTPAPYASTGSAHFENVNTRLPAIPRALGAGCPSETSVRLSWERRSVNEASFHIERRVGGGAFAEIGTAGAGALEFLDTAAHAGSRYEYRVRAANDSGTGAHSRIVTVVR